MSLKHRSWDELQERFVVGEPLSDDEAHLRQNPPHELGARELRLAAELAELLKGEQPAERALAQRVLELARSPRPSPQLRLVPADERPEPNVLQPMSTRGRSLGFAALGLTAAAAATALGFAMLSPAAEVARLAAPAAPALPPVARPARAELMFASGQVTRGDAAARLGGQTLQTGERLETAAGHACLHLDPDVDVCLAPHTRLEVSSLLAGQLELRVVSGLAVAALAPRSPGQRFSLLAEGVSAEAKGTVFAVEARQGRVSVSVAEGQVAVKVGSGERELVHEHARLTSVSGSTTQATLGRAEEAELFGLLAVRRLWDEPELALLEISAGGRFARAALDDSPAASLPLFTFVPAGKRRLVVTGPAERTELELELAPGERRALDLSELGHEASQGPIPTPTILLEAARQELRRGNRTGALTLYAKLRSSFPKSVEASTVLITMGKLELDRSGAPTRALQYFDTYLKSGGPLAPEALSGKIRALRALGREGEERAAIDLYLSRYPQGVEASALRKRLKLSNER